jgi:lactate racemase
MQVHLAFGRTGIDLTLPNGPEYRILEVRSASALVNGEAAIEKALDSPTVGPSLLDLAANKRSAAISVCDITRPAPNKRTLPPILRRLQQAGISKDQITICIATGLHRLASANELDEILGADIVANYPVYNHNARELDEHTFLGETSRGTQAYVAKAFIDVDLRITLGFIEPHLMAGFSGGRKLVAPGLAYEETIKTLHSPKFMRDARAAEGRIEQNPLNEELWEISDLAGHHFMLDVALNRNREIAGVFSGQPRAAHAAGVSFVSGALRQQLDRPADAVITTCAGYPLDMTFYQAIKGVTAAANIVKNKGRILLFSECQEGAGAQEFTQLLLRCKTPAEFLSLLDRSPVTVDQWMLEKLALVFQRCEVLFHVPGLAPEHRAALWGTSYDDIDTAVQATVAQANLVAVIPEGPYVLAQAA